MRESNVCDDLGAEYSSKIPLLVELRTDKAGTTRYRSLSLSGTEMEPQWVPMPNQHAGATGWLQAGNFTKMDFQLAPDLLLRSNRLDKSDIPDILTISPTNIWPLDFQPKFGIRQCRSSVEDEKSPFDLLSRRKPQAIPWKSKT